MAIKNIITRGIGFSPGGINFIVTRGYTSSAEVAPTGMVNLTSKTRDFSLTSKTRDFSLTSKTR